MRLLIVTSGTQFRVAGPAKPKQDYKDKERQATTRDGEPIWTVRLDAIETERERKETIWVEVAGDEPKLTFDGFAQVRGLVSIAGWQQGPPATRARAHCSGRPAGSAGIRPGQARRCLG